MTTATLTHLPPSFRLDPGHPPAPRAPFAAIVASARRFERMAMSGAGTPAGRVVMLRKAREGYRAAGMARDAERCAGLIG